MKKIGVLVSGGGTNLQALIDAQQSGIIQSGRISLVVSDKPGVYALERAERAGIKTVVVDKKAYADRAAFDHALAQCLKNAEIDLVVMAGFLSIVGKELIVQFKNRIINIHPALVPSFCGEGFYGLRVHQAALDYGVKLTGATVHFVNEVTDGGAIIAQKSVPVLADDTAQSLQRRVMEQAEWVLLPRAVELFCAERLSIDGRRVIVKE